MNQEEFNKFADSYDDKIQLRYIYGLTPAQKQEATDLKNSHPHAISQATFMGVPANEPWFNIMTPGHSRSAFRYFVYCPLQMVFKATEDGFIIDWVGCNEPIDVKYEDIPKLITKLFKELKDD